MSQDITMTSETVEIFTLRRLGSRQKARLLAHDRVLIQSNGAFWRANRAGYTDREHAAEYTGEEAWAATFHCGPEKGVRYHLLAALSRAPEAEDRLADEKREVVAALYKAWPDAEDIPSDWPLGIIGCIEQIIRERDDALADRARMEKALREAERELAFAVEHMGRKGGGYERALVSVRQALGASQ